MIKNETDLLIEKLNSYLCLVAKNKLEVWVLLKSDDFQSHQKLIRWVGVSQQCEHVVPVGSKGRANPSHPLYVVANSVKVKQPILAWLER